MNQERCNDINQLKERLKALSHKRTFAEYMPRGFSGRRRTGGYLKYCHRLSTHKQGSVSSRTCRQSRRRLPMLMSTRTKLPPVGTSSRYPVWLHTHKWHVKRFRMCRKWGVVLGKHHAARGLRFVWTKLKSGSILHDMSYVRCVELCGSREECVKLLSPLIVSTDFFITYGD